MESLNPFPKKRFGTAALIGWLFLGSCTTPAPVIAAETFSRVQQPLTVNEVPELRGYLGERWQANRAGSIEGFDIEKYVRLVEERKHYDWWWAGEQDGKWLESAILSSVHSDPKLREKARTMLNRVIASQEPDGYVGVTAKDIRTEARPLRGMDPYELYFTLHAFITAYEQWGDTNALHAAEKLGNYFIEHIGPEKAEFWPGDLRPPENRGKQLTGHSAIAGHSVHYSWEGTLLIDPMLRLAQVTGDSRYTDWSKWVVNNIDRWSGWDSFSKLDQVAAGKMGIQEVQPYVHAHTFHMNFLGFLRLYELTGDRSYLTKVAGAWKDIASRQMYITGGVSVGEHYEAGSVKPVTGNVVETCATMSWLQMTEFLLELTGEVKYADAMEKLLWNHVFASQAIDGECYRYHTPPNGVKPEGYFRSPDCCTASGHRMVSLLPTFLYGKDERGIFVNQFSDSTVEVKLPGDRVIRLRQSTRYPEEESVRLTVEAAPTTPLAIRLRLPTWCANPQLTLNGKPQTNLTPGTYFCIERRWQRGDKIDLVFPMQPKWIQSDAPWKTTSTRLPSGEIMQQATESSSRPWALTRGPMVYAVDTLWWSDTNQPPPARAGDDLAVIPDLAMLREVPKPEEIFGPTYTALCQTTSGQMARAVIIPFTDIGRWYRSDRPRPGAQAAAYSYAVWLLATNAPEFQERVRLAAEHGLALEKAVDVVVVGDVASEAAHQVHGGNTGEFNQRAYRHGTDFSYQLKINPTRNNRVIVSYWGSDTNREFDIFVDEHLLATERLENKKPGTFFDQTYEIPVSLFAGKTDNFGQPLDHVVIRFKSRTQAVAGGVFGLRVE